MRVLFRVDASRVFASGHVMRCLTLARALAADGAECRFACRMLEGHMIRTIHAAGFKVDVLSAPPALPPAGVDPRLGVSEASDAAETVVSLGVWRPDWVVVDHYSLARSWETAMRPQCGRLLAIDDYTDRPHACDTLLNQNLGASAADYVPGLLPPGCTILAGTGYALLRPEFARHRPAALERRQDRAPGGRILVTMGGVDPDNTTGQVLAGLAAVALPASWTVIVVMGEQAPHLAAVRAQTTALPFEARLVVNTNEMAQLMVDADIAIGAAGSTSWERCALALPSIVVVLADNQVSLAQALEQAGAAIRVNADDRGAMTAAVTRLATDLGLRADMAKAAAAIADGHGTTRVVAAMTDAAEEPSKRSQDVRQAL